jgi:hypothetical protein
LQRDKSRERYRAFNFGADGGESAAYRRLAEARKSGRSSPDRLQFTFIRVSR